MPTERKSAANRRNAKFSTGPQSAEGKAAASLNARTHGLNTPVPDYIVEACAYEYRALLDRERPRCDPADLAYALAGHARVRRHRARLMQTIVSAAHAAVESAASEEAVLGALAQLAKLETYDRKSRSRLGRLLGASRPQLGKTKPRAYLPESVR